MLVYSCDSLIGDGQWCQWRVPLPLYYTSGDVLPYCAVWSSSLYNVIFTQCETTLICLVSQRNGWMSVLECSIWCRLVLYDEVKRTLTLLPQFLYQHSHCLLTGQLVLRADKTMLLLGATDGNILLVDLSLHIDMISDQSLEHMASSHDPLLMVLNCHQSGVNALRVLGHPTDDSRLTIYSGGDDNCLSVCEVDVCSRKTLSMHKYSQDHSAQITGIAQNCIVYLLNSTTQHYTNCLCLCRSEHCALWVTTCVFNIVFVSYFCTRSSAFDEFVKNSNFNLWFLQLLIWSKSVYKCIHICIDMHVCVCMCGCIYVWIIFDDAWHTLYVWHAMYV